MPDRQAIDRGRAFEQRVNDVLHLQATPSSGNRWHARGDGAGGGVRVESKAENKKDWATVKRQVALAAEQAQGTGDVPVLATLDDDGTELVVMTLESFARIRTELVPQPAIETKAESRRRRAGVPALLRGDASL